MTSNSAVGLAIGIALAQVAIGATPCPRSQFQDLHPASTLAFALDLPDGSSRPYKDDPYERAVFLDTPQGRIEASSHLSPIRWWARDLKLVCHATIDGHAADLYTWTGSRDARMGAWFERAPPGERFLIDVPIQGDAGRERAMAELQSLRFINDPQRLRLVEISGAAAKLRAVFKNELGVRREVGANDTLTAKSGWVAEIRDEAVVVKEPVGPADSGYRFYTYHLGRDGPPEMKQPEPPPRR